MRRALALLALMALMPAAALNPPAALNGKSGRNLKDAVAATCRPTRLHSGDVLDFHLEACQSAASLYNPFTGEWVATTRTGWPDELADVTIAPLVWWADMRPAVYGDTLRLDLLNRFVAEADNLSRRFEWPVGEVDGSLRLDQGLWLTGTCMVDGAETNCWTPPDEIRGDVARTMLYMATIYPAGRWNAWAALDYEPSSWPGLTSYALDLFLRWHRADPPSDTERRRNVGALARQGNVNPFVEWPELVEYIWGVKNGQVFETAADESPLRSTYSLADGSPINLSSPWVPADAVWSVDGRAVSAASLDPSTLGLGQHELTFTADGGALHGAVTIVVKR